MPRTKPKGSFQFGTLTYSVGLALIVSAAVLNLCIDKLSLQQLYMLPDFLVDPYEQMGHMGVTLALGGVGVMLVTLGIMGTMQRGQQSRTSGSHLSDSALLAASSAPTDSRVGGIVLATAKYVGKRPFEKARAVATTPAETATADEPAA